MDLRDYFEKIQGTGVLSTAAADGTVNSAIYARPHVLEDGTLGFIMANRRTYQNIVANPKASYLFKEDGVYRGVRLYLTKLTEDVDPQRVASMRRRMYSAETEESMEPVRWVTFRVDSQLPLVGSESESEKLD